MLAKERHDQIIAKLNLEGNVRVKDLSRDFDVTEDCIRKDLTILEREGKLKRIHGGATKIRENLHYFHVDDRRNIAGCMTKETGSLYQKETKRRQNVNAHNKNKIAVVINRTHHNIQL